MAALAADPGGSFEPEVFEPGRVSTAAIEDGIAFLPGGGFIVARRKGVWGSSARPSALLLYTAEDGGEPVPLFPELTDVSDPAVSAEGSRLVFTRASWDEGKRSDQDLWIASRDGTTFVNPRPLGPEINSGADEMGASFGPDGALWFSSTRAGGLGSGDLWRAAPSRDGNHAVPRRALARPGPRSRGRTRRGPQR